MSTWQELLCSTLTEANPSKLEKMLYETETALLIRSLELCDVAENAEIDDFRLAASALDAVRVERLGWPDYRQGSYVNRGDSADVVPEALGLLL